MTEYLDIVPLELAKKFLRVDADDFDDIIEIQIVSACKYFEQKTQVALAQKEKLFKKGKRYYIDPINDDADVVRQGLFFRPEKDVTLTIGYASAEEVPTDIINCLLQIVQGMYQAEEANEYYTPNTFVSETINYYKRFWI